MHNVNAKDISATAPEGDLGTALTLRTLGGLKVRLIPTWALNTSPAVAPSPKTLAGRCQVHRATVNLINHPPNKTYLICDAQA
ncbi:uncharacterized [Tachysurus ichikawai]